MEIYKTRVSDKEGDGIRFRTDLCTDLSFLKFISVLNFEFHTAAFPYHYLLEQLLFPNDFHSNLLNCMQV